MGLTGMDVDAVRDLARQMDEAADRLEQVSRTAGAKLGAVPWDGADAHRFRAEWHGTARPALTAAVEALRAVAGQVRAEVADQREASADTGGLLAALGAGAATVLGSLVRAATGGDPATPMPPRPPAPPLPPGDGQRPWNSQPWYSRGDDLAVLEAVKAAAVAADAAGYVDAARHLRHYLGNTGETLDVDVTRILRDVPEFRAAVDDQVSATVKQTVAAAVEEGRFGVPVAFTSGWSSHYLGPEQSWNWYLGLGGVATSTTGYVVVSPDPPHTAEVHHQVHLFDRYNWDGEKSTKILGVTVTDREVGGLHTAGLAREFEAAGDSEVVLTTYSPEGDAVPAQAPAGPSPADAGEGTRTDATRDQQIGPSRLGADGRPR